MSQDSRALVPYAEGWARFRAGSGQLELHVLPGLASVGYRLDLVPLDHGLGLALEPSALAGFFFSHDEDSGSYNTDGTLALGGGMNVIIQFRTRSGACHIVPRVGYSHAFVVDGDSDADFEVDLLTLGVAIGYQLGSGDGIRTSLELSVHRFAEIEAFGDGAIWTVVPSVALRR